MIKVTVPVTSNLLKDKARPLGDQKTNVGELEESRIAIANFY